MTSFLVSGVGFVFFSYGRKMSRAPQMLAGLVLFVFPYFVDGPWIMLAGAVLITGLLWLALRWGW